jgi:hypothetical protein
LKSLLTQDLELGKVLSIRQSLGQAALSHTKLLKSPSPSIMKESLSKELGDLLHLLFPLHEKLVSNEFAKKVIDDAIIVRNQMTEEKVLYRCFLLDGGEKFVPGAAEARDPDAVGEKVSLCLFVGVERLSVREEDNRKEFIVVTKAKVNVE